MAQETQESGFDAVANEKRRPAASPTFAAENIASCLEHCSHRRKKPGNEAKYGGAHSHGRIYGDHFTFYFVVLKNNISDIKVNIRTIRAWKNVQR